MKTIQVKINGEWKAITEEQWWWLSQTSKEISGKGWREEDFRLVDESEEEKTKFYTGGGLECGHDFRCACMPRPEKIEKLAYVNSRWFDDNVKIMEKLNSVIDHINKEA